MYRRVGGLANHKTDVVICRLLYLHVGGLENDDLLHDRRHLLYRRVGGLWIENPLLILYNKSVPLYERFIELLPHP